MVGLAGDIGNVLLNMGMFQEALDSYDKALEIHEELIDALEIHEGWDEATRT